MTNASRLVTPIFLHFLNYKTAFGGVAFPKGEVLLNPYRLKKIERDFAPIIIIPWLLFVAPLASQP